MTTNRLRSALCTWVIAVCSSCLADQASLEVEASASALTDQTEDLSPVNYVTLSFWNSGYGSIEVELDTTGLPSCATRGHRSSLYASSPRGSRSLWAKARFSRS